MIATGDFENFVRSLKRKAKRRDLQNFYIFRPQQEWISLPGDKQSRMQFVGRFEYLDDDIQELKTVFQLLDALEHHRATTEQPGGFTDEMISIIGDLYERDVVAFGYSEASISW